MSIKEWFISDIYSNCFTLVTVVLSGLISLIISTVYYKKGNRNNLKMTVMFPIVRVLKENYSRKNYNLLCEISKEYSIRYMNEEENKKLITLLDAYKDISSYNDTHVNAAILFSYFEYKLRKNGIEPKVVPVEYEGEIVYYDYPPDLHYLSYDLEKVLHEYDLEISPNDCKEVIIRLYSKYCEQYYSSDIIKYFDDYTLEEVLGKSKIRQEWDGKFDKVKKAQEEFLNLESVRETMSEYEGRK